ncbi:MAG TPA: MFS transporter [Acidimicrobiales bacterium]|nr:MFS transporter [Acidimicrobiales bacterium]
MFPPTERPDLPEVQRPEPRQRPLEGARLDLGPLRTSRDLRLLFFGGGISYAGSMLTFVALPYQAYRLTHSSLVVGLLSLAQLVALLITGLVGGALADAFDKRRLLRVTEAGLFAGSVGLVVNVALGHPRLWVLFGDSFLLAAFDGIQSPALDSLVPRLVPTEQLAATSALMSVRTQVGMIAAPALSGVLISVAGLQSAYEIDAATYAISFVTLWMLGKAPPPEAGSEMSVRAIVEGLRYAFSRKDLLGSYLVDINAMFFGVPNALFPQIAARLGGASVLGFLYSAPAVGAALVTVTSGWTARVARRGRMIAAGATVWGLGIVALGFASAAWAATLGLAVAGAGDAVSVLGRSTMWNESIPDALRGRLAGVELLSYSSGPTLGNVESGLVETFAGLRAAIVSGGVLCVVGSALLSLALPTFWRYDATSGRRHRTRGPDPDPADDPAPDGLGTATGD